MRKKIKTISSSVFGIIAGALFLISSAGGNSGSPVNKSSGDRKVPGTGYLIKF